MTGTTSWGLAHILHAPPLVSRKQQISNIAKLHLLSGLGIDALQEYLQQSSGYSTADLVEVLRVYHPVDLTEAYLQKASPMLIHALLQSEMKTATMHLLPKLDVLPHLQFTELGLPAWDEVEFEVDTTFSPNEFCIHWGKARIRVYITCYAWPLVVTGYNRRRRNNSPALAWTEKFYQAFAQVRTQVSFVNACVFATLTEPETLEVVEFAEQIIPEKMFQLAPAVQYVSAYERLMIRVADKGKCTTSSPLVFDWLANTAEPETWITFWKITDGAEVGVLDQIWKKGRCVINCYPAKMIARNEVLMRVMRVVVRGGLQVKRGTLAHFFDLDLGLQADLRRRQNN